MATRSLVALALWIVGSLAAGAMGAVATQPGAWYAALDKPAWTPPNWLFGPVWTTLYVLMGVAAWMVWEQRAKLNVTPALALFVAQLAVNALWSWFFFGFHRIGLALVDIVVLWVLILAVVMLFWRARPLAGGLLLPYIVWVSYATALNASIWLRNSG
jgi:tryptophan-rich sensory protein